MCSSAASGSAPVKRSLFLETSPSSLAGYDRSDKQDFNLLALEEKDLADFFASHDKTPKSCNKTGGSTPAISKATDVIHFIWMGNPIKDSDKETIESWKTKYPSKQIIIWVDKKALEDHGIVDFANNNHIKLIDLEEIFLDEYTFGLSEFIKLEKNRLPPNWGAVSDIYRYLIMYYFAGTYSDTDSPIGNDDDRLDFDKDMAFYNLEKKAFLNDRIMTKNMRQTFWLQVFNEIKNRYQSEVTFSSYIKPNRLNYTIKRSGPELLKDCITKHIVPTKLEIQFLDCFTIFSSYSWSGKLTDKNCESLSKEKDIVQRLVANIIIDLTEKKSLNLCKYDKIIAKIPKIQRRDILDEIKAEIQLGLDTKDLKVQNIFAENIAEYEDFLLILKEKGLYSTDLSSMKENINKEFIKAAKRKNLEMFKSLFNKYPQNFFPINSDMIELILQFDDKKLFLSILNYAKINNQTIDLYTSFSFPYIDLALALKFFEQIKQHAPHFLEEESKFLSKLLPLKHVVIFENIDKLQKLKKLLNIIPLKMFPETDRYQNNALHFALSPYTDLPKAIAIIREIFIQRGEPDLWAELILTKNAKGLTPIQLTKDYEIKKLLTLLPPSKKES